MISQTPLSNLYGHQGKWRELVPLYRHYLLTRALHPTTFTFPILLRSCPHLQLGQAVHADAAKRGLGLGSDPFVSSALVDMYYRCGSFESAHQVFDEIVEPEPVVWNAAISSCFRVGHCKGACQLFDRMLSPNDVTWSAMVAGYTRNGHAREALLVFKEMRGELVSSRRSVPNSHTVASVLSACVQSRDLSFGMQVHGYTIKISNYADSNEFVGSVLVDMYGRCGCVELARQIFDSMVEKNVVAWSSLIANYVRDENPSVAVEIFKEMVHSDAAPNDVTLTTTITACAHIPSLVLGKELHGFIVRRRLDGPDSFVSSSLIDMYGKCSSTVYARRVFEKDGEFLGCHVAPMWNAMVSGYVVNNHLDEAWSVIRSMSQLSSGNARPNSVTLAIVLPLCARSTSLLHGKEVHCYAIKNGFDRELLVANGLLDMYCKCGKINSARNQFGIMPEKNRISWTTLIDGYGMDGDVEDAISVFESMVSERCVDPDPITFVALISACSHAGLVEEGLKYFKTMTQEYGILPTKETCGCVVDLLARAGQIDEAREFIATMPIKPSASIWGALLGACRVHGEVDEAETTVQRLLELEPKESGGHTLLSYIYAERGRIDEVVKVQKAMVEMGAAKRPGCSWLY